MSDPNVSWFHCGRCGLLFQASAGQTAGRRCPECGANPSTGMPEIQTSGPAAESEASRPEGSATRSMKADPKRKGTYFMLNLFVGWSVLLVFIVLVARKLFPSDERASHAPAYATSEKEQTMGAEDAVLFYNAGPQCAEVLSRFLTSGTPEARNQFVLSPISGASRMAHFQSLNPVPDIDPATLTLIGSGLVDLPGGGGKAYEAQWQSSDGKILDTFFQQENGEWRLDWEHFVRYSDHPWPLFLAGTGPDEGEFRLMARERLAEERKKEKTISLALYAPRFGQPSDTGFQSPEMLVSRDTLDGQLLDAAFKLVRGGGRVLGGKLPSLDPHGIVRVRVKVRRSGPEDARKFEITAVKACHWYSINDPGVTPERPAPEEDQKPR